MNTRSAIYIVSLLVLGSIARADPASIPYVDLGRQEPGATEATEIPNLTELEANWWRYFEVGGDELKRRIQKVIEQLEALPADLPKESAETARSLIARIRNNLQALPAARTRATPTPPMPSAYEEKYSIAELLDIARRQRKVQTALEATRYDVAAADGAIKNAQRRIDTRTAAYLALDPASPERVIASLEIMADRSEIALAQEKLRVSEAALQAQQVLLQQLVNEQATAAERLRAEYPDFERLTTELVEARAVVTQAQERLNTAQAKAAQARAASIEVGEQADRTDTLYRQQQALHAMVAEAAARVRTYELQTERLLVLLVLDIRDMNIQVLHEQLSALSEHLSGIREQIGVWIRESQRERDRAGEAMAQAIDSNVANLNQARLNVAQETLVALQRLEESIALTELLVQQVEKRLARREGLLRSWSVSLKERLNRFWDSADEWINLSLFKLGDTPVTARGLLQVSLIIFVFWLMSYWLRRVLVRLGRRREGVSQAALYTVARLSHYLIVTIGLLIGLGSIGIDFTNLALVAGAIGIGVGFGLQSIVANFVSGLILLFERSLKVGDFVQLASGVTGEVRSINVRSTIVTTNDNVDIVVPNLQFINGDVTNWTLHEDYARIHIPFRVAYGADKDLVKTAALEAANKLVYTLKTKRPGVWLVDFAEDGMAFELVVWITPAAVKRPGAVNAEYRWEIETALRKYGVEIPVPQRDLRLRSDLQEFLKVLLNKEAA